jgi:hypothetical protein
VPFLSGGGGMKKRIGVSFFLILVLFLVQTVSAASALRVQSITNQINEPQLKFTSNRPYIQGLGDEKKLQKINVRFKEKAETTQKTAQYVAKLLSGTNASVDASFDYIVKRNQDGILSIVMNERIAAGVEKGMNVQSAMIIDTISGKFYKLQDFFKQKADYTATISDEIKRQMKQKGLDKKLLTEFRQIKHDEDFYITGSKLVIFFQQYEYLPYECGITEFEIPLKSLDGILKPEYTAGLH